MADLTYKQGQHIETTCGGYSTERASCKAFDAAIEKTGLFTMWREVTGETVQPIPGMKRKEGYRIDRILVPTDKLREAGWTKGLIGVELKKSNIKAGQPLSQMLDYLRCVWNGPKNIKVWLDYCFLWPMDKCGGPLASIMAQNHIGGCYLHYAPESEWYRLQFFIGEQSLVVHYLNQDKTEVKNLNFGEKTGSRG